MKVALVADTHFGYARYYEDAMQQGREAFEKACSMADIVILAGDIFDMKVPRLEVLGTVMDILECGKSNDWKARNHDGKTPIVAIHGTHERRSKESVNPIQILERAGFVTNIHESCTMFEKEGEKVGVCGFGGVPDEFVREEMKKANITTAENAFNIFVFHQTISEFIPMAKGLSLNDLPSGFDLYVCGHIHKKMIKEMDNGKLFIIPGSTVITQLKRDEVEEKGFILYDTKERKWEFVPVKSRVFLFKEIVFAAADSVSVKKQCRESIEKLLVEADKIGKERKDTRRPIIKIQISGSMKEGLKRENLDLSDIADEYNEKCALELENDLDSKGLSERIELFRKMYE